MKLNEQKQAKTGEKFHWRGKNGILVKLNEQKQAKTGKKFHWKGKNRGFSETK